MSKVLINLNLPFMEFSKDYVEQLRKNYSQYEFIVCNTKDDILNNIHDAEVLITFKFDKEMLDRSNNLKWVQGASAGVDFMPLEDMGKRGMILTNGRGIHKVQMAEYAIMAMIMLSRNFHVMVRDQFNNVWGKNIVQGEINGATVGILGLGSIGRETAKKASLMGMNVIGLKNTKADVPYVNEVYGPEEMEILFEKSDYVINLLPYTEETEKIIDQKYFNIMKESASFINIGRGKTVNEKDLINALENESIKAAVMDVFYEEPLDENNPLWSLENVIITPHICGQSTKYMDRLFDIVEQNIKAYVKGNKDDMINLVDLNKGY